METVGDRIRAWRRRRGGMSQQVLADLAGFTQAYISQVESGRKALDRKRAQAAIAGALNISVAQLLGQPSDNPDPTLDAARRHVPAVRTTLIELSAGERREPARTREQLALATTDALALQCTADHVSLAAMLPDLLRELGGYGPDMAPQLVDCLYSAQWVLRSVGVVDLARQSADIALCIARDHEDSARIGLAGIAWAHTLPPEDARLSFNITAKIANEIQAAHDRDSQETYGQLHLRLALDAAILDRPDDAYGHLAEAAGVADSLGEPERFGPSVAGFASNWFGPTNVALWRIGIAVELGDAATALSQAQSVDLSAIPVPNRQVYFHGDVARALAASGKDREAMHALAAAERVAPQHFRFSPITRDLVTSLIARAKRRAVGEELATLARKLGLDPL